MIGRMTDDGGQRQEEAVAQSASRQDGKGPRMRDEIVIIEDTREQMPLDFAPYEAMGVRVERRNLRTGDYSVAGYERHFFVERKSLKDLVGTLTHGRDRFNREIYDRAAFYPVKHLVVEASWAEISRPYSFSGASPLSIVNSLFSVMLPPVGMHVFCAPSRALVAWYIVMAAANFVRRATHGSSGMWRSIFAPDSADLAPLAAPEREVIAAMDGGSHNKEVKE